MELVFRVEIEGFPKVNVGAGLQKGVVLELNQA